MPTLRRRTELANARHHLWENAGVRISLVIPYFNGSQFIREALQSVLAQTRVPDEIIVVDDGSSPAESAFLHSVADGCKVIRQDNRGVSVARNVGIAQASGEWVAFLDQDDLWSREKIEEQVRLTERLHGVVAVHTAVRAIGTRDHDVVYRKKRLTLDDFLCAFPNPAYLSSVLIKKDTLLAAGLFNPCLRMNQDHDCFMRVARYHAFEYVDLPLTIRRNHDSNQSSDWARVWEEQVRMMVSLADLYPSNAVWRKSLMQLQASFMKDCRHRRDFRTFLRMLLLVTSAALSHSCDEGSEAAGTGRHNSPKKKPLPSQQDSAKSVSSRSPLNHVESTHAD